MRVQPSNPAWYPAPSGRSARRAFTLLEVLLALIVLAIVMVVVHSVFQGAVQLRNHTDEVFAEAIPLQHTLAVIKNDVVNLTVPGGTLSGALQTSPTTASSSSLAHLGRQCGPAFYNTTGEINDFEPWAEMRKVSYFLEPSTNSLPGYRLVRSVTRNLLPVAVEEFTDQTLMSGVSDLTFEFYNGTAWVYDWDSTAATSTSDSNSVPAGVRVQLTLVNKEGVVAEDPIVMVVPIAVQPSTNSTSTTGSNG